MAISVAFAAKFATVDIPVRSDLYSETPQALTPTQCAQCHVGQFGSLKENGGLHRFDCQGCHKVFHAYNAKKGNYAELMPKCSSCHAYIHGPANKDCDSCHTNPHTPRKVAMTSRLANTCATCHAKPKADLVKFPSKHSLLGCAKCHTSHGFKPSCSMCHKPHYQGQEYTTCKVCHSVHKPKMVTYQANEPARTCGSCHTKIYAKWQASPSKHAKVLCAQCHHDKHGYVPQCAECHKNVHPAGILKKFPRCLDCHLDVHELPGMGTKTKK
jgi:predicted CXXCH cytochrome family protein